MKYASGKNAWGMCARSGRRMKLLDMVTDPRTGALVDPGWAEPRDIIPRKIEDGIALFKPAPDRDRIGTTVYFGEVFDLRTGNPVRPLNAGFELTGGTVSVT